VRVARTAQGTSLGGPPGISRETFTLGIDSVGIAADTGARDPPARPPFLKRERLATERPTHEGRRAWLAR